LRRLAVIFAWLALGTVLCGLVITRPHVVERWALFLGSAADPRNATLYLDPFPNDWSCESRARLFRANAEPAFCGGRLELSFGAATDAVLAADFNGPWALGAYCRPRQRVRVTEPGTAEVLAAPRAGARRFRERRT